MNNIQLFLFCFITKWYDSVKYTFTKGVTQYKYTSYWRVSDTWENPLSNTNVPYNETTNFGRSIVTDIETFSPETGVGDVRDNGNSSSGMWSLRGYTKSVGRSVDVGQLVGKDRVNQKSVM